MSSASCLDFGKRVSFYLVNASEPLACACSPGGPLELRVPSGARKKTGTGSWVPSGARNKLEKDLDLLIVIGVLGMIQLVTRGHGAHVVVRSRLVESHPLIIDDYQEV